MREYLSLKASAQLLTGRSGAVAVSRLLRLEFYNQSRLRPSAFDSPEEALAASRPSEPSSGVKSPTLEACRWPWSACCPTARRSGGRLRCCISPRGCSRPSWTTSSTAETRLWGFRGEFAPWPKASARASVVQAHCRAPWAWPRCPGKTRSSKGRASGASRPGPMPGSRAANSRPARPWKTPPRTCCSRPRGCAVISTRPWGFPGEIPATWPDTGFTTLARPGTTGPPEPASRPPGLFRRSKPKPCPPHPPSAALTSSTSFQGIASLPRSSVRSCPLPEKRMVSPGRAFSTAWRMASRRSPMHTWR